MRNRLPSRECKGAVFTLLIAAAFSGCSKQRSEIAKNRPPEAHYVDTGGCVECHRDIVEAFAQTGMGRSFSAAGPVEGRFYHAASDRYYEIGGGKMTRYQIGPFGQQVNRIEKSIDYVIGSGNHARTFIHRNTDGSL